MLRSRLSAYSHRSLPSILLLLTITLISCSDPESANEPENVVQDVHVGDIEDTAQPDTTPTDLTDTAQTGCIIAEDCSVGQACLSDTNECGPCRVNDDCRANEACLDAGVCGSCNETSECEGQICLSGLCLPCEPPDGDLFCQSNYGEGVSCQEDGRCAPDACLTGADCYISDRVCIDNVCSPCSSSSDCLAAGMGDYPLGTLCIEGRCLQADCDTTAECPEDAPICGTTKRCRPCQLHSECLGRSRNQGEVFCDPLNGRCAAGIPCGEDSDCPTNFCEDGQCRACELDSDCGDGRVCSETLGVCVEGACASDANCIDPTQTCELFECAFLDNQNTCIVHAQASTATCLVGTLGGPCYPNASCNGGLICIDGRCETACPLGQVLCEGRCVTLDSDPDHCGSCGQACDDTQSCERGVCQDTCSPDTTVCDQACAHINFDPAHCGGCDLQCNLSHARETCVLGECLPAICESDYGDCDGLYHNGCESLLLTDAQSCGACGVSCAAGDLCIDGECQSNCGVGLTNCDGFCADLSEDPLNCGVCDNSCVIFSGSSACQNGFCAITDCDETREDCDGVFANGCETDLTRNGNCGGCGVFCFSNQGSAACTDSACTLTSCLDASRADCDNDITNGCESSLNSLANCGACDAPCTSPNDNMSCATGTCVITSCADPNTDDCDDDTSNGCETDLTTLTDCGGCGVPCVSPDGPTSCTSGACVMTACNDSNTWDCNDDASDGCEANLMQNGNCGGCGVSCAFSGGSAFCDAGSCVITSCSASAEDCDGVYTNGCETSLTTLTDCGGCDVPCASPDGATSCATGSCVITSCTDQTMADCDGDLSNGCETDLLTTLTDCGTCGNTCGVTCDRGLCEDAPDDFLAYIKAFNTGASDNFGYDVAVSGDGSTLVVGAYLEDSDATGVNGAMDNNNKGGSGAAYVYIRDARGAWVPQAYLKAQSAAGYNFGESVSISADGDTIAVSAPKDNINATGVNNTGPNNLSESGAVYVFTRVAGTWSQQAFVKASNTASNDIFGHSIALSDDGDTLAVGTHAEDGGSFGINGNQSDNSLPSSGAVYVFTRVAGAWSQQAYIKASTPNTNDYFGIAVALSASGDTLAVGANGEDGGDPSINGDQLSNSRTNAGATYVFVRDGAGAWGQQAYIKPNIVGNSDLFGREVALSDDGNTLAVGARNEASQATGVNGDATLNGASNAGAVYVFTRVAVTWSQHSYIKASNTEASDFFGDSIALSSDGTMLAVGAYKEDSSAVGIDGDQSDNSLISAGAAYAFRLNMDTWSQVGYVKAPNSEPGDIFGYAVALSGDGSVLAIGAYQEDSAAINVNGDRSDNNTPESGAVFLYGLISGCQDSNRQDCDGDATNGCEALLTLDGNCGGCGVSCAFTEGDAACEASACAVTACTDQTMADCDGDHANGCETDLLTTLTDCGTCGTTCGVACDRGLCEDAPNDLLAYIKAFNTGTNDNFGYDVAVSEDGNTLVVGAYLEDSDATGVNGAMDNNNKGGSGAAYVYIRDARGAWVPQAYLKAQSAAGYNFGESVSISADGDTIAVSAPNDNINATGVNNTGPNNLSQSGAVYVFTRVAGTWSQQAFVKASNTEASDLFGHSIALSDNGDTLAVGAYGEDGGSFGINGNQSNNSLPSSGAVYVFTRVAEAWSQQAYIKASTPNTNDYFSIAVALSASGDTLAVGAHGEDSTAVGIDGDQLNNSGTNTGATYVFVRDGAGAWGQQAYIKPNIVGNLDLFGLEVALSDDGNTLAVGARDEDSQATGVNGDATLNGASNAGAVYVFTRVAVTWSQHSYIKASNTEASDFFGDSIALSSDGTMLAVGAYKEDSSAVGVDGDQSDNSLISAGAAYAFRLNMGTWSQVGYIKSSNTDPGDIFGYAVALSGDGSVLAVGAYQEDSAAINVNGDRSDNNTSESGAVFLYTPPLERLIEQYRMITIEYFLDPG